MSQVLSPWRATYVPGDWVVLAGPTSLVVIQPLAAEWSELITALWQQVLASSSIVELADQLVAHGIADMPSFGAFFWTTDGMRSLVRGGVVVRDLDTGRKVADGNGVQTWNEVGLGDLERVRIETPRIGSDGMELPLLVGAVHAAALTLDASPAVRVSSGQGIPSSGQGASAEPSQAAADADPAAESPNAHPDGQGAEVAPEEVVAPRKPSRRRVSPVVDTDGDLSSEGYLEVSGRFSPLRDSRVGDSPLDPVFVMENGSTRLMPFPFRLVVSDGQQVELDQIVRIGRAPSPERDDEPEPKLVTVASPNQDISRTHVQISTRGGKVQVTDLHSTNGTVLVLPDTSEPGQRLPAGEAVDVPPGSLLDLGDGVSVLIEAPVPHA
jgi:hypothetical protein